MDFNYSADDEAFRQEFRTWLAANAPREGMQTLAGGFEQDEDDWKRKLSWFRKLASGGWTCVDWPREFGGRGLSTLRTIIYHEELQSSNSPLPFIGSGPSLVGPTLMQWGTDEQKRRFIPNIISGKEIWCQGY
jgi:alkylation response protein AidB-like acyl-CoA dehydrogenase